MSTQINIGAEDFDQAVYVFNALRQHLPEFLALFSNSNRVAQGCCSEIPLEADPSVSATQTLKKAQHALSFTYRSTIELRCCDSQRTVQEDMAIAAYVHAISQFAKCIFPAEYPVKRQEDLLDLMFSDAATSMLDASVNNQYVRGWIDETLSLVDLDPLYGRPVLDKL
jgi:gamma-glutamyl:cysteine ligase YbdK (ATP-grasp superfamily)